MLNQLMASVVVFHTSLTYGILVTAILFLIYGVFGLLEQRPRPVNIVLAVLALVAGVLLLLGK